MEWLDALITVSLNPGKTDFNAIEAVGLPQLKFQIKEEIGKIQSFLKKMVFSLGDEKKIKLLVRQYHSSLIILLDQAIENNAKCPAKCPELKDLISNLTLCVDELLSFIELRFLDYLSINERVPATYLAVTKKDISSKLNKLKAKFKDEATDKDITEIVLHELSSFIGCSRQEHIFNFKELSYMKEICKELEQLNNAKCDDIKTYTCLDQLLVYMNFNSKSYIDNFTQRIAGKINYCQAITNKMEMLLLHFKAFKQMHHKPGLAFDANYNNLEVEISNWFTQEIFYLEKKLHYSIVPLQGHSEQPNRKNNDVQKVLCILSVDQMAIVLRCVDDLKIVMTRSLNALFKGIVPFLSTPYQENISYDSMRSKSYAVETRDKEIVIKTLEEMVKKIREY